MIARPFLSSVMDLALKLDLKVEENMFDFSTYRLGKAFELENSG